ncbi:Protein of unknown function [Gryllus bimaculatus]|nr:Protein of unknown function [Gryllus bimaculatus]
MAVETDAVAKAGSGRRRRRRPQISGLNAFITRPGRGCLARVYISAGAAHALLPPPVRDASAAAAAAFAALSSWVLRDAAMPGEVPYGTRYGRDSSWH